MMNIFKINLLLFILLIFLGCEQLYLGTEISPEKEAEISAITDLVTVGNFSDKLLRFTEVRNVASNPDEVVLVEDLIIADLENWADNVVETEVTVDSVRGSSWNSVEEGPFTMRNIIATKYGTNSSLKPILIGAHHDTVYVAPGTNDNGSGCAGVLEIASILQDYTFERDIIYAFFAFEEDGLVGSQLYVDSLSSNEYPESVIILETIGFTSDEQTVVAGADLLLDMPTVGDFIGVFGSYNSRNLLIDYISSINSVDDLPVYALSVDDNFGSNPVLRDLLRSDHGPFWSVDVPALMITDTADLRVGNFYHTSSDTYDNVNLTFATKVVQATISAVCKQAGLQ